MVITVQTREGRHELKLQGRFDANWADHVGKAIEAAIREGHHNLELDFADVGYISSAGIRVLLKYHKQLKAARGSLRVAQPPAPVLSVLRLSGLWGLLSTTEMQGAETTASTQASAGEAGVRRWQRGGVEFESHDLGSGGQLEGQVQGRPEGLAAGTLAAAESINLRCATDVLAVGIGAFGHGPEDTQGRFGEALAVGGVAVTLPTDGSSMPDYQLTEGEFVPELQLLYGLIARGNFSRLLRFEASGSPRRVVSLGELVESVLEELQCPAAAFAILAESASVVGAMLQRSPALAGGKSAFTFPAVRDWLTFTTERTDERNLVLIAGMAGRSPTPKVASCLRPVGPGTSAHGHFHAAVFPYRPLPKGRLELSEAVAQVLGTESAQTVMHLLADEREFEGVGQTDLMRGACWSGPLRSLNRVQQG
jgi:anti-anti-sigma factor